MKLSVRTRVALLMILLFIIILVLSVFSGYHLNKLSNKTSAILKENYLSVVYAREMSEGIMIINQEIASSFLSNKNPDSLIITKELSFIDNSLKLEKSNITDPGEDKLVSGIETDYTEYRNNVIKSMNLPQSAGNVLSLQNISGHLYQQLVLLSQMNGKSIENKTDDAKAYAKKAFAQMSVFGTFGFLIALVFMSHFARYFNDRFFQLHNGIKELVSSNYGQRLYFEGEDEFSEIALVFNEMAQMLSKNIRNIPLTIKKESEKEIIQYDVQELKEILARIKTIEEQVSGLISKLKTE
jgi:methyl-accepting chemotaxis protein